MSVAAHVKGPFAQHQESLSQTSCNYIMTRIRRAVKCIRNYSVGVSTEDDKLVLQGNDAPARSKRAAPYRKRPSDGGAATEAWPPGPRLTHRRQVGLQGRRQSQARVDGGDSRPSRSRSSYRSSVKPFSSRVNAFSPCRLRDAGIQAAVHRRHSRAFHAKLA